MKYVNRVIGRDGVARLYFRKRGHPANGAALTNAWPDVEQGSELEREVAALLSLETVRPRIGNLAGAIRRYELEDPRWGVLEGSTKAIYRYFLKEFTDDLGDLPHHLGRHGRLDRLEVEVVILGARDALGPLEVPINPVHFVSRL